MSDDAEFLARWSRRKREANRGAQAEPEPTEPASGPAPSDGPAVEPADPAVDLSSLPPIESIDAATDITAFLRRGIPPELSRAALRRAWTADPAIRNFVGLAENAWDFNDPNAMPGFGSLGCSAEQLAALVSRVVGGGRQVIEELADAPAPAKNVARVAAPEQGDVPESNSVEARLHLHAAKEAATAEGRSNSVALQPPIAPAGSGETVPVRRRHGGALPR